jgi:hypothetical protein
VGPRTVLDTVVKRKIPNPSSGMYLCQVETLLNRVKLIRLLESPLSGGFTVYEFLDRSAHSYLLVSFLPGHLHRFTLKINHLACILKEGN